MQAARRRQRALVEPAAELGPRGAGEAGPVTARDVGRQGELADDEQAAADRGEVEGLRASIQLLPSNVEPQFNAVRPAQ